jgi:hypothetical protein
MKLVAAVFGVTLALPFGLKAAAADRHCLPTG